MKWRQYPIVAFDTETTGLEPFGGDRIIELAVVVMHLDGGGGVRSSESWSTLLNPEREIPRKVTEITGIGPGDVADKPRFADVALRMREMLASGVTVAHNYPFDLAFLTREFEAAGLTWPEPIAEVDTVDLSIRMFPDAKSHRLTDLAERLGIKLERAHRATDDAEACGRAFVELSKRHDVDDELQVMLDWAGAIGRPPEGGPVGPGDDGRIVFLESDDPHRGKPISAHPIHLAWMERAKVRSQGRWRWRYPDATRRWIRRWLEVRAAGRARQGQKGFHSADWAPDPCIALPRHGREVLREGFGEVTGPGLAPAA